jgi:hypothetical protein
MFSRIAVILMVGVVTRGDVVATEDLPELDSANFSNFYDGTVDLENADPAWILSEAGVGNKSEVIDGVFHYQSSAEEDESSYAFWVLPDVAWANFPREKGFTLEVGLQPDSGKCIGINLAAAEEVGAGYAVLRVLENCVEWAQGPGTEMATLSSENNGNAVHVFRIVKLPSLGKEPGLFNVYRDGKLIGEELEGRYGLQEVPTNRFYIGDVGTWDSAGSISFIRWDSSGAYAPKKE